MVGSGRRGSLAAAEKAGLAISGSRPALHRLTEARRGPRQPPAATGTGGRCSFTTHRDYMHTLVKRALPPICVAVCFTLIMTLVIHVRAFCRGWELGR